MLKTERGFTVIEMLIASVVFAIIFGAAMSVLVSSMRLQKYNLAQHELMNQASYAVEYMARALRMAVKDDGSCGSALNYNIVQSQSVSFMNYNGDCQRFYINNGQLMVSVAGGNLAGGVALTSDNFEILNLNFYKTGDGAGPLQQPKITVFIHLRAKTLHDKPEMKIQTTVSQRNIM